MRNGWTDRLRGRRARWSMDIGTMSVAIGIGALAAWHAFPFWDDAALWLSELEGGPGAISDWQPDRPVLGMLTAWLASHGVLWSVGAGVYVVTWFMTGLVSLSIWRRAFPEWASYGLVVSLLAISPVLLETQALVVNNMHIEAILAYGSQWLVWRRSSKQLVLRSIVGGAIVLGASLLSEYATLATIVAAGAYYGLAGLEEGAPRHRTRDRVVLAAMIGCGLVGYLVYLAVGNADARPEVRPERQLATLGWQHVLEVPVRLPFAVWTGVLGELLKDLGAANLSRATVWGLPCGILVALATVLRIRSEPRPADSDRPTLPSPTRRALALAVPVGIGLCAILLMSTTIRGNVASRYWQPLSPVLSSLTLFCLFSLVRLPFRTTIAVLCAFTAGYLEGNAAAAARANKAHMKVLGEQLRHQLAPTGMTAAVFVNSPTNHALGDPVPRPYELMAHLTRGWSNEERKRFWAGSYEWQPIHASAPGLGGVCGDLTQVDTDTLRGWRRKGSVAKVIWVSFDADGVVHIEPIAAGEQTSR